MNGKTAKKIRNNMYYPRERSYRKNIKTGTIIADQPRRDYQQAKKQHNIKGE